MNGKFCEKYLWACKFWIAVLTLLCCLFDYLKLGRNNLIRLVRVQLQTTTEVLHNLKLTI